ncbi:hypothetical protein P9858_13130 [Niallia circulans]|uniref:hypothetical protein n=1 Tax=Niallia circulans TaxID=1397 RepID=UPI002E2100C6|nr:hypothetical protein [Niallia circulans]
MKKEETKLDEFKNVKEVIIIDDGEGKYNGQRAAIIDADEHSFGVDLRLSTKDGGQFWISSDSVEIYSKEV